MVMIWSLLMNNVYADGFNDAYDEEVEEYQEYQEALEKQTEAYRFQLEVCKEMPDTEQCHQFLVQHAINMGLDPDKFLAYVVKTAVQTDFSSEKKQSIQTLKKPKKKPMPSSMKPISLIIQGGVGLGDVARSYDTRVGFLEDAQTIFDIYEYNTFFPGRGATINVLLTYAVNNRLDVGLQFGALMAPKGLSTGWQIQNADGDVLQEDSFQQVVTSSNKLIEPRAYIEIFNANEVYLDVLVGLYTRLYDGYIVPDAPTVNYSNQPGGLHYGYTLGLSAQYIHNTSMVVSIELPWTYVVNQQPYERSILLEDSYVEGDAYVRGTPDRPPYSKQVILPKLGVGYRF